MAPTVSKLAVALACVSPLFDCVQASKTVSMKAKRRHRLVNRSSLVRRADPFPVAVQNYIPLGEYFITASVGTPGQDVELVVDTGSSDVWMFGPDVCNPKTSGGVCAGGSFDSSQSSSYKLLERGGFEIQYVTAGSGVRGDYFSDDIQIGGMTINGLTMALATKAQAVQTGIMGIGLDVDESIVGNQGGKPYPNLPDLLVEQNLITTKSYSMYLDDLAAPDGTFIFGGYDEDKFEGDLIMLPLQPDSMTGEITSFSVAWTGLYLQQPNGGGTFAIANSDLPIPVVLDSGTTISYVPGDMYAALAKYFKVEEQGQNGAFIDCNIGANGGSLAFEFGGKGGPVIAVPFSEFAVPSYNFEGARQTDNNGNPVCFFGIHDVGNDPSYLLGQTFLRSAYVMYDLDNLAAGLAPVKFGVSTSNIKEFGSGSNDRISTDANGPTAQQTATGFYSPGGGYSFTGSYDFSVPTVIPTGGGGVISAISTDVIFPVASPVDTGYPTSYGTLGPIAQTAAASVGPGGGGGGSGGSTSTAAASGLQLPKLNLVATFGCGMAVLASLAGGLLLL